MRECIFKIKLKLILCNSICLIYIICIFIVFNIKINLFIDISYIVLNFNIFCIYLNKCYKNKNILYKRILYNIVFN